MTRPGEGRPEQALAYRVLGGAYMRIHRLAGGVAYPRTPHDDGFWRVSDVPRLLALVRAIERCVPVAHVAAVGLSNGGLMANALACQAARRVRAIVLVSAGYRNLGPCRPAQPVSGARVPRHPRRERALCGVRALHGNVGAP